MKIKKQFIILSSFLVLIPILCSVFIIIHTYMHSPNRYLMKGVKNVKSQYYSELSSTDIKNLENTLKLLPQDVEALLIALSNRTVVYSTINEIPAGRIMRKDEVWSFVADTSEKYFYQFTRLKSINSDTLLLTRLPQHKDTTEKNTRTFLKILLAIIIITIFCLIFLTLISNDIFKGLYIIEKSSTQLAEGKLNQPIKIFENVSKDNEFICIMNSLEKMRRELLEMQSSKKRFITGISHDLRTPVSVIRGYSEAIKDNVITDSTEIKKSMELIEQKTVQLEGMIDTLLNYMKLNNNEIKENLEPHSITSLIKDFVKYAEVTGKIFKRNVQIDINIDSEIKIPLNEQLVHRSFENLLSNAIRYTKDFDNIEIRSYIETKNDKRKIILQIIDSGSGIAKKDLDHIFDLFYRGTNSRQEEGMGIGLTVVKSIMDTHGWEISVTSKKNEGSCFTIEIPY